MLLPGTGEHGYLHRRTSVALPLARLGVATLVGAESMEQCLLRLMELTTWCVAFLAVQILEGPFYGKRRPSDQRGSKLRR